MVEVVVGGLVVAEVEVVVEVVVAGEGGVAVVSREEVMQAVVAREAELMAAVDEGWEDAVEEDQHLHLIQNLEAHLCKFAVGEDRRMLQHDDMHKFHLINYSVRT